MLGNPADHLQYLADPGAVRLKVANHRRRAGDFLIHRSDGGDGGLHHLLTGLGTVIGVIGRTRCFCGMTRNFLGRGGHFMHRRGHLVGALKLVIGAAGHAAGQGTQFAAGGFQLTGIVLQASDGIGEKIPQGIGRDRQTAQLVLAVAGNACLEAPLAQLRDIVDQAPDRLDQAAIYQPQAEQADQQCRAEHHQQPQPHGPFCRLTDRLGARLGIAAQLGNQRAHLFTGGAVYALDGLIAGHGIAASGKKRLAPALISLPKLAVACLQLLGARLERCIATLDQLLENALHLLLTGEKLLPVFIPLGRLLAAQQHVFPFLDLNLELQIGLIDQL
ncbi:hypothetical protein D3C77_295700 [compost metagenome]